MSTSEACLSRSLVLLAVVAMPAVAAERFITVASTTSTENSGLFGFILPKFQQATGIEVRVVAVGTGQAIKNAERGDADVLFVHHQPSEEQFVAQGFGVKRHDVMYNDYVLLGPQSRPRRHQGHEGYRGSARPDRRHGSAVRVARR